MYLGQKAKTFIVLQRYAIRSKSMLLQYKRYHVFISVTLRTQAPIFRRPKLPGLGRRTHYVLTVKIHSCDFIQLLLCVNIKNLKK